MSHGRRGGFARWGRVWGVILWMGLSLGLVGCNTMQGLGEDIEAAGGAISNTAKKAKPN